VLTIVAIVIGAALGAAWDEGSGLLIGAVVGWLLVRSWRQQRDIAALQQSLTLRQARAVVAPVEAPAPAPEREAEPGPAPALVADPQV